MSKFTPPQLGERNGWPEALVPGHMTEVIVPSLLKLRKRFLAERQDIVSWMKQKWDAPFQSSADRRRSAELRRKIEETTRTWAEAQPEWDALVSEEAEWRRHRDHMKEVCPSCGNIVYWRTERGEEPLVARQDSKGYDGGAWHRRVLDEGTPCDCAARSVQARKG